MTCNNDWTIRFPDVPGTNGPLEIRPNTLTLNKHRTDYAFARGSFSHDVGDMMKPHTRSEGGRLRNETLVEVCHDGEPIQTLYFSPDFADYGYDKTHIEFQDPQKTLDSGVVDKEWSRVTLREAYEYVFNIGKQQSLLTDIRFTDDVNLTVVGEEDLHDGVVGNNNNEKDSEEIEGFRIRELDGIKGAFNRFVSGDKVRAIEADATRKLVDSFYALSFDQVSPLKAIYQMNEKFSLTTWVDADRTLWVGSPESHTRTHIAAPDDRRVWRYSAEDVSIRHPREPIKQVVLKGAWVDQPGWGTPGDLADEAISWFNAGHEGGTGDFKAVGVARRTDIEDGVSLLQEEQGAKRDSLTHLAHSSMREEMKKQHSGTIEIEPELSGDYSPVEHVAPGELLHVVPNDHHFSNPTATSGRVGDEPEDLGQCTTFINNEVYLIKEVQHSIKGSHWSVTLDVVMYPDALQGNVETSMVYFDPSNEEWITAERFNDWKGNVIETGTGQ